MFKKGSKPFSIGFIIIADIILLGISLLVFAYFHHVRPAKPNPGTVITIPTVKPTDEPGGQTNTTGEKTAEPSDTETKTPDKTPDNTALPTTDPTAVKTTEPNITPTPTPTPETDYSYLGLGAKFYDKFNLDGSVTKTDDSYVSGRVAVYYSTIRYGGANCHVADIYVCDISSFSSILANDRDSSYEGIDSMDKRKGSVVTINGDYYVLHRDDSFVVRNGVLYHNNTGKYDVCALYSNGVMICSTAKEFDADYAISHGVWQAWTFGPKLLYNGRAVTDEKVFSTMASLSGYNPRTAVGYYEPGHYCFVAVDGRTSVSPGLSMLNLSAFMESLGCKDAYNLDGGDTSAMYFGGELASVRSGSGTRSCSDALAIIDSSVK